MAPSAAAFAALAALALAGCAQGVTAKEDMLAAAGFDFRPANTPEKIAFLRALPAHSFVHQVRDGKNVWFYADPSICGCLYAGNDVAYQKYREEVFQKRIADEQMQAAQMNQNAVMEQNFQVMNWAMWGPWAPYYGY